MRGVRETDYRILALLSSYPQGLFLSQIQRYAKITSLVNANRYMKKLMAKQLVRKDARLYFITEQGLNALFKDHRPGNETVKSDRVQRPHAIQANAKLYATSASRIRRTLQALNIPYTEGLKGNIIAFRWEGREIRASKSWLYTHSELQEAPINIPMDQMLAQAATEAATFLEPFLLKSGLRCVRDRLGALFMEVHYWENGYPGNEIAEKGLEDKGRIIYAVDTHTGAPRAWADKSLNPFVELETNSRVVDDQMKQYIQAIENREIEPYRDEMEHRRREEFTLATLEKYAEALTAHIPILQLAEKMLKEGKATPKEVKDAIDQARQRRL